MLLSYTTTYFPTFCCRLNKCLMLMVLIVLCLIISALLSTRSTHSHGTRDFRLSPNDSAVKLLVSYPSSPTSSVDTQTTPAITLSSLTASVAIQNTPAFTINISQNNYEIDWCNPLHFGTVNPQHDGVVALASFPGSGNTWVRYLLQQATGIITGSMYNDTDLFKRGFPGIYYLQISLNDTLKKFYACTF